MSSKEPKPRGHRASRDQFRKLIRAVFLQRRESYGPREVQRLTGMEPERVRAAIQQGELEGKLLGKGFRIRWPQLAALAFDRWSMEEVESALGEDTPQALPPLVRIVTLTARVPQYQVSMLEEFARRGISIDATVTDALLTVAEDNLAQLRDAIPGLEEAIHFPE